MANKLKGNAGQSSREAFRANVLFDTNQLLQKAESAEDVIRITAQQVKTLLDRDVMVFPCSESKELGSTVALNASPYYYRSSGQDENEAEIAQWVFLNQAAAGAHTEMFYTGQTNLSDSRRGIGLGLALCKSIVEAHGGMITLADNHPTGCCFTFSLPAEEMTIHE